MTLHYDHLDQKMAASLREMTEMGHPEAAGELISLFLDTFSGQLAMLLSHAERNEIAGLHRVSIDLRSSSTSIGAHVLADRCAALAGLAASDPPRGTAGAVWSIIEEFESLRTELEALIPARV